MVITFPKKKALPHIITQVGVATTVNKGSHYVVLRRVVGVDPTADVGTTRRSCHVTAVDACMENKNVHKKKVTSCLISPSQNWQNQPNFLVYYFSNILSNNKSLFPSKSKVHGACLLPYAPCEHHHCCRAVINGMPGFCDFTSFNRVCNHITALYKGVLLLPAWLQELFC